MSVNSLVEPLDYEELFKSQEKLIVSFLEEHDAVAAEVYKLKFYNKSSLACSIMLNSLMFDWFYEYHISTRKSIGNQNSPPFPDPLTNKSFFNNSVTENLKEVFVAYECGDNHIYIDEKCTNQVILKQGKS